MTNGVVHKTHCCLIHGCKYGDDKCPVVMGRIIQKYPCDKCNLTDYSLKRIKEAEEGRADIDANTLAMFKRVVTLEKENKVFKNGIRRLIESYSMYIVPDTLREFINLIDEWGKDEIN